LALSAVRDGDNFPVIPGLKNSLGVYPFGRLERRRQMMMMMIMINTAEAARDSTFIVGMEEGTQKVAWHSALVLVVQAGWRKDGAVVSVGGGMVASA
jgi:hypothetical protein